MNETLHLDLFDLKLLAALQADGRLTNFDLAEKVGLSASQCSRRRTRLEDQNFIKGYRALIDRGKTGFGLIVFINVTLNTHSKDNAKNFADLVMRLPQVEEAYALTGEMDYQIKLSVRNLKELSDLVNDQLMIHDSVQTVRSSIVLNILKEAGGLPLAS